MKIRFVLGVMAVLISMACSAGLASDSGNAFASPEDMINGKALLKGLKSVVVCVDAIETKEDSAPLDKDSLKTKIELCLRKLGVNVVDVNKRDNTTATLRLEVFKHELYLFEKRQPPIYDCYAELKCSQFVWLSRDDTIGCVATTWRRSGARFYEKGKMSVLAEDAVNMAEAFANDYLAMNPPVAQKEEPKQPVTP